MEVREMVTWMDKDALVTVKNIKTKETVWEGFAGEVNLINDALEWEFPDNDKRHIIIYI